MLRKFGFVLAAFFLLILVAPAAPAQTADELIEKNIKAHEGFEEGNRELTARVPSGRRKEASRRGRIALATARVAALPAFSLQSRKPYAGEEQRGIKALSAAEAEAYLKGEGMGFAKAAELNHYPGPRHVLELSGKLGLTEEQAERAREIYARMHTEAVRLGKQIVEKEEALDRLFAEEKITATALSKVTGEIARLQGELRAAHLKAHLEMKRLLTAAQVTKYDALRGYSGAGSRSRDQAGHAKH